ncbi:unnamed protein product [Nyctereutes procyonoides]|uniref:(raccoon dog) hypothetical protein n=1 Tax=Nyctereutes procyonoides TaxID=34880 RepID=A0A811YUH6_NYCPR|nr:unnamed protein product [Nyctereutes procyonoides]
MDLRPGSLGEGGKGAGATGGWPETRRRLRAGPDAPAATATTHGAEKAMLWTRRRRRRRRLASSPARVGGKVGRQEELRDERGEGAQPAPDLRAPRLLPHSALRFRLWRVRRGSCGRAGARGPGSGPPPPGSARVLAEPREPRGRRSTPGGGRGSAPPARAGTMEPRLVPRRRGGGRAPVRRPGSPDPAAPLSEPGGGASRFSRPGLHRPAGAPAPRRARLQPRDCAPRGPAKSPRFPRLFQLRRALAAGEGEVAAMR